MWLTTLALINESWIEHFCLPNDGTRPLQGHLLDDPDAEAILQHFLTFGPAVIFLFAAIFRVLQLRKSEVVVVPSRGFSLKAPVSALLLALQTTVFFQVYAASKDWDTWAPQLLFVLADAVASRLSVLEHERNVAPSALLITYHSFALLNDVVQTSLKYVAWNLCNISRPLAAGFAIRMFLLVLECHSKRAVLNDVCTKLSPEETAGFYGRAFFWWVNVVLTTGYSKTLSLADMPPLAQALDAKDVRASMQQEWERRIISRAIKFVSSDLTPFQNRNEALRLILAAFIVYTGTALLNGTCNRMLARIKTQATMVLTGLIYASCLKVKERDFDGSTAMTLMSSDTEDAAELGEIFHTTWSRIFGLLIGMYMLYKELGWVCVLPPVLVYGMSRIVEHITENLGERVVTFREATQTRLSIIQAVLDSMKNVKMMGLVTNVTAKFRATRVHESKQFVRFHQLSVFFFISGLALHRFSSVFTLVFFAIQAQLRGARSLDMDMIFTSLAIVDMVTGPSSRLLGIVTQVAPLIAAFDRIQAFLLVPDRRDQRVYLDKIADKVSTATESSDNISVQLKEVTIRPTTEVSPVLLNISTTWNIGDLVIITGPVGTGKTTLIRALLGELWQDSGTIQTAHRSTAYCSQTAWLINGTIRNAICGPRTLSSPVNQEWYKKVIQACDLDEDIAQMPDGDQTIIGSRGTTLSGGQKQRVALARAVFARKNLVVLDDVLSALDASTERHIVNHLLGSQGLFKMLGTTVVLITHATQHLHLADHIIVLDAHGGIAEQGTWQQLRNGSGFISTLSLSARSDREVNPRDAKPSGNEQEDTDIVEQSVPSELDIVRDANDFGLHAYYLKAVGFARLALLIGSLAAAAALSGSVPYWLKLMAESGGQSICYYTGVYFLLSAGAFGLSATAVTSTFLIIAPHAGNILHDRLLSAVMNAPQSYFAQTETGTILNRFTTDIASIDRALSLVLFSFLQAMFLLISQFILLGTVQPVVIIVLPLIILVVFYIQKVYLATSRQLSSIDLEAEALVNSSFLETLEGLSTIRAFGWQQAFIEDNARKLDLSLRPDYLLVAIQCWLDLVLDLIVPALAVTIIALAAVFRGTTTGGQIGIALNVVLAANGYILRLVTARTKLETSLGAVSRVRAFERDVLPEDYNEKKLIPPTSWPSHGSLHIKNIRVSYKPSVFTLDNVSLSVTPGMKVGIVGRTGSGKSSLLLTLLRLVDLQRGSIYIDGLDITTLDRTAVRSRIITIPQDPMLIRSDTIRQNLDIAGSNLSDDEMVRVLDLVGLWKVLHARKAEMNDSKSDDDESTVKEKPLSAQATLNTPMSSLPLSLGQEQLLSLARALLMRSSRGKIVLLDEATSSVDAETDRVMQKIVREEFKSHTVTTVAHRLESILDSDVVVVMSKGKIVEMGPPDMLRRKEDGAFRALFDGRGS